MALPPQTSRLDRYIKQRDEWETFTCSKLVDPVEKTLRQLARAAVFAAREKGIPDPGIVFKRLIENAENWSNENCQAALEDTPEELDSCLRMAVRAQATVMALTIAKQCNETIRVPRCQKFFRSVLATTGRDHEYTQFLIKDLTARESIRKWISATIRKQLLDLVPICIFADDASVPCDIPTSPDRKKPREDDDAVPASIASNLPPPEAQQETEEEIERRRFVDTPSPIKDDKKEEDEENDNEDEIKSNEDLPMVVKETPAPTLVIPESDFDTSTGADADVSQSQQLNEKEEEEEEEEEEEQEPQHEIKDQDLNTKEVIVNDEEPPQMDTDPMVESLSHPQATMAMIIHPAFKTPLQKQSSPKKKTEDIPVPPATSTKKPRKTIKDYGDFI